jgi:preprotein translocase subunit SecG
MLYKFLLVILVIDAFVLIATILLQSGKGSGLAANFGGASSSPDAFIGIRQAGTILTKGTWWSAGIFLALAFVLQIMSTQTAAPKSVLEKTFTNQPAPAAPPTTTNPAIPLTPVTGGTTAPATTGAAKTGAVPLTPAAPPSTPATKR